MIDTPPIRHLHTLGDLDRPAIERLCDLADHLRGRRTLALLEGRTIVCVFFNPSLRTRVSMEVAAQELGARVVTLNVGGGDVWRLEHREGVVMNGDKAEHIKDAARVLAGYGDLLAVRAFPEGRSWEADKQDLVLKGFMRWAGAPILNLESSLYHPCQAFADVLTIRRALGPKPGKVVLSWADHPKALPVAVPSSFALAVTRMGWDLTIARPDGYDLPAEAMARCRAFAAEAGSTLDVTDDRDAAFDGAHVVYAKSWGRLDRYGNAESEIAERKERGLARWIVDQEAMGRTADGRFMHCLPVRRNVVVADAVLDDPRALVWDQAENRLHGQKALLCHLLGVEREAEAL